MGEGLDVPDKPGVGVKTREVGVFVFLQRKCPKPNGSFPGIAITGVTLSTTETVAVSVSVAVSVLVAVDVSVEVAEDVGVAEASSPSVLQEALCGVVCGSIVSE